MTHHLRTVRRAFWVLCALLVFPGTAAARCAAGSRQLDPATLQRPSAEHPCAVSAGAVHTPQLSAAAPETWKQLNTTVDDTDPEDVNDVAASQVALASAGARGDPPVQIVSAAASHCGRSSRSSAAADPFVPRPPPLPLSR